MHDTSCLSIYICLYIFALNFPVLALTSYAMWQNALTGTATTCVSSACFTHSQVVCNAYLVHVVICTTCNSVYDYSMTKCSLQCAKSNGWHTCCRSVCCQLQGASDKSEMCSGTHECAMHDSRTHVLGSCPCVQCIPVCNGCCSCLSKTASPPGPK